MIRARFRTRERMRAAKAKATRASIAIDDAVRDGLQRMFDAQQSEDVYWVVVHPANARQVQAYADASGITLEEAFAGIGMKVEWRPKETA